MCLRVSTAVRSGAKESLMRRKRLFDSSLVWVQMTLAGCGCHEEVCVGVWWTVARIAAVCVCAAAAGQEEHACVVATTFSALPMHGHLSPAAGVGCTGKPLQE